MGEMMFGKSVDLSLLSYPYLEEVVIEINDWEISFKQAFLSL